MAPLANFQSDDTPFQMLQNSWSQALNPLLANPSLKSLLIKDITLAIGANVINHRLGRTPQGYRTVDANAAVTIYRSAPFNDLTLTLTSDAVAIISLEVF